MRFSAESNRQAVNTGLAIFTTLALIIILLMLVPAHANSFTVQPIRVDLSANQQVFALRVRNTSQQEVSIQLEAKKWQQPDGRDFYTDTDDLLAVPPIFTVAANQTQTVRIGLRRPPDDHNELSYRLYLRELPKADANAQGVKMALHIGIPVFVKPRNASVNFELEWSSRISDTGERLLVVTNHGNGHAQITRLEGHLNGQDFNRSLNDYVLPGVSRQWVLPPDLAAVSHGALQLQARVNGKHQSSTVQLD